jgi:DNA repair exonuclease SbcCD ATPase subunit
MQINKININNYGNLSNKEINLDNKINIIYGKNEAGKSTLLNFIESMFFGANKNKGKKLIPDFDRYNPWNNGEYSGTIDYQLENGEEFHVYRDFKKKNPQILNKLGKDISQEFNIDKKNGNQFFTEQTGMDRSLIDSTIITEQNQVELDEGTQNQLLQKIANLSESGEEELSYKKIMDKLNKILLNEVGTERSQLKPLNITISKIDDYQNKIQDIKQYENERFEITQEIADIQEEINKESENRNIYDEVKKIINNDKIEQEKIDEKYKTVKENKAKMEQYKEELDKTENEKNNERKKQFKIRILANVILSIIAISLVFLPRNIILVAIPILIVLFIIINMKHSKNEDNTSELTNKLEFLKNTTNSIENEIKTMQDELYKKDEAEKNRIITKCNNEDISSLFSSKIDEVISENTRSVEQNEIKKHKLEIDKQEIEKKFEKLAEYEENLEIEKRRLEELEHKQKIIKETMEILNKSYEDMKENVAPKFNKNLSKNIEVFSNEKYKEITITDKIFVKLDNGENVPIEKLSTGTIEQIYLAFRLSVIEEISKEKMPIVLDEAFAYYDDERLLQTLKFLDIINNQIIILTCTKREKSLLDKAQISYNLIEL